MTYAPPLTLQELDERVEAGGLRVRLLWSAVSPSEAVVEVYEGFESHAPTATALVPGERAREAFLHPCSFVQDASAICGCPRCGS